MGRRCSKCVTTYSKPTSLEELELFKDDKASQVVLFVKNPQANAGDKKDKGSIPGSEDPLEEEMAIHSSILTWRIPWTEEPSGSQFMGSQRVGHD